MNQNRLKSNFALIFFVCLAFSFCAVEAESEKVPDTFGLGFSSEIPAVDPELKEWAEESGKWDMNRCHSSISTVTGALEMFVMDQGSSYVCPEGDLEGQGLMDELVTANSLRKKVTCQSGGKYVLKRVNESEFEIHCTLHGTQKDPKFVLNYEKAMESARNRKANNEEIFNTRMESLSALKVKTSESLCEWNASLLKSTLDIRDMKESDAAKKTIPEGDMLKTGLLKKLVNPKYPLSFFPICPGGGRYSTSIEPIEGAVSCSVHGSWNNYSKGEDVSEKDWQQLISEINHPKSLEILCRNLRNILNYAIEQNATGSPDMGPIDENAGCIRKLIENGTIGRMPTCPSKGKYEIVVSENSNFKIKCSAHGE